MDEWTYFINTGFFKGSFNSQRTPQENSTYSKVLSNVREFMQKNIPNFINGMHDPGNDEEWNAYCDAIAKYKPETNTQIMQGIYDRLNQ